MKKYYMVTCHRGHCSTGHSTEIKFAFYAESLLEACDMAKKMPSVKHSRPVINAQEITEEEYYGYRKISAYERSPQHKARRKRGR